MSYIDKVKAAQATATKAQAALDADTARRERNGGPWGEDDTYLRLNTAAYNAAQARNNALRGR